MGVLVKPTAKDVSLTPVNQVKSDSGFFWSMGLIVSALYQLGIYALKRGGSVEFQCGPLRYRVNGKIDREANQKIASFIDLQ